MKKLKEELKELGVNYKEVSAEDIMKIFRKTKKPNIINFAPLILLLCRLPQHTIV